MLTPLSPVPPLSAPFLPPSCRWSLRIRGNAYAQSLSSPFICPFPFPPALQVVPENQRLGFESSGADGRGCDSERCGIFRAALWLVDTRVHEDRDIAGKGGPYT